MSKPIDQEIIDALGKIADLAPGDFKIVRDRFSFYPQGKVGHWDLVKALQDEAKIKEFHKNDRGIGF